jgi:hypothetical protein
VVVGGVADVSETGAAFIFMVEPEDGGSTYSETPVISAKSARCNNLRNRIKVNKTIIIQSEGL